MWYNYNSRFYKHNGAESNSMFDMKCSFTLTKQALQLYIFINLNLFPKNDFQKWENAGFIFSYYFYFNVSWINLTF